MKGIEMWYTSIHNGPRPFSKIGVCFGGGEGKMGGSVLVPAATYLPSKTEPPIFPSPPPKKTPILEKGRGPLWIDV